MRKHTRVVWSACVLGVTLWCWALECGELVIQASNNTKAQFANSPTLSKEIMNAVMHALAAHTTMSKQAIGSERVREGLKEVLLGPGQLYEALKDKAAEREIGGGA